MPVVAIRKNAWDAGNDSQKWAMRLAARKVELGQPALYEQPNGTEWLIAHDTRVSLLAVAILGTVAAGLAQFPNWVVPEDKAVAREQVYDFVRDNMVLPRNVALTEVVQVEVPVYEWVEVVDPETGETYTVRRDTGQTQLVDQEQSLGDPYDLVLAAQGAPSWIAARESLPNGLSPVEVAA